MEYNAADIVGKTLFALTRVPIKRQPWDDSPIVTYAEPGQKIGIVYTYVGVKAGRSVLHWAFVDDNNVLYYTEHRQGYYNLQSLKNQGVLTKTEKAAQQALANQTMPERVVRTLTGGLIAYGVIRVLGRLITR